MKRRIANYSISGMCVIAAVLLLLTSAAQAEGPAPSTKTFQMNIVTAPDGKKLRQYIINGPPAPPPGLLRKSAASLPAPDRAAGINTLSVPAYRWAFGCSAVSGAMIAGYYDRSGWDEIYTGPTNGGVIPLGNSPWPDWTDGYGATYASCPLVASSNGLDGRTTHGSIDDYWVQYLGGDPDPYMGNWDQHAWGDAIGDYMKTSQYAYNNVDGSTTFYTWSEGAEPLYCGMMEWYYINNDGTQGIKQFYEAKGYVVADCYNQPTDNFYPGGFSFEQYKTEIDAGRPVMLNLEGHSVVGVGYDDSTQTVYLHDTWDNQEHTMTWGGSYAGMNLLMASVSYPTTDRVAAVTVGTSPAGRPYSVDGTTYTTERLFIFEPGSSHTIATTSQQLGGTRYVFDRWSDGGEQSHIITPPSGPSRYTAFVKTEYQLVTQVVPMGQGTVYPPTGFYPEGETVNVSVKPARNYIFSSWGGPVNDSNINPTTVTMTAPATVTANVTGNPTLTPSITAKTGLPSERSWTVKMSNSGKGLAANVRLIDFIITQTSGHACSPTVTTAFPVFFGNVAVGSSATNELGIDFSGCEATAKFTATMSYAANGGVTGSKVFRNQTQ